MQDTPENPSRNRLQRALEIAGITAFFGLTVLTLLAIARNLSGKEIPGFALILFAAVLGGLLAADLISGFVHWAADNWGSPTWPILGPGFIHPFRHHHVDPVDIARHGFVELNGNNCIVTLPVFYLSSSLSAQSDPRWALFGSVFTLSLSYWVFGTNQFHAWAHMPEPPRIVQFLQRTGLILSKPHHDIHHVSPHDQNYCITNGWMNHPLRWLRVFTLIERIMTRLTGVRPQHLLISPAAAAPKSPS